MDRIKKIGFSSAILIVAVWLMILSQPIYAQAPAPQTPQNPVPQNPAPQAPATDSGRTGPQNPQSPAGSTLPPHVSSANCDICGYCNGMTVEQIPDRWQSCRKCVYPALGAEDINPLENKTILGTAQEGIPAPDLYHIYTDLGCLATKPGEFAAQISSFFFSIVGGLAFLFFIYGAGVIATSRADVGRLEHGKRIIYGAIAGLIFTLFAVFIIRFIATGIGLPNIGG